MKAFVETTHALSLPGVIAGLLWAAFPKKIILSKAAKGGMLPMDLLKKRDT
jgi:hypothetical protein